MKVKKGTIERPSMPEMSKKDSSNLEKENVSVPLSKDDTISLLVNQGLDGDMDAVNACEDKIIRAKAKAMIMKVKKGTIERPPIPKVSSISSDDVQIDINKDDKIVKNTNQKVRELLKQKFPDSLNDSNSEKYLSIKPDKWLEIAKWLKTESSLHFDSLQCQMGIDVGNDILESRYNLHSMEHNHYIEVRIPISRSNPNTPSVEEVWRIADWFERETYDMLGIVYTGHRDLRRILLPDDWEGWPLRKDYQVQETYHGIVVPKMKEGWE